MRAFANKKIPALLVMLLATAGLVVAQSAASNQRAQAAVSIELCAKTGDLQPLPATDNGVSVPIWGFGIPATPGDCTTAAATLPGPPLTVDKGDNVTLTVHNALPAGHTLSMEIPGISFDPGPVEAAVGSDVTVSFIAGAPGTYLYQSGGDAGRQEGMGLYGALVVRSATDGQAYDDAGTAYDGQATLVLSQVDPAFNAAPDTYDLHAYNATYWLINGKSYPDADPITASAGDRVLLRYLNAGYDNTTMSLLGAHENVVAKDANLLGNPYSADAETIPAGATEDAITTVPAASSGLPNGIAVYNRQEHLTNGACCGPNFLDGGQMTFIHP